jgi:outer membrane protein OmpA-like peptidoglycan-associated protein
MTSMRSALLFCAASGFVLSLTMANAEEAGARDNVKPLLLAQTEGEQDASSETMEELDPLAAAEKAVEDARTALRQAMATGGDVREARRNLQAAIKSLNEVRDQAGLEPTEEKVDEPDAAEAPSAPAVPAEEAPAAAAPETSPSVVLPQTTPILPPTLAVPQTPEPELPTLASPESPTSTPPTAPTPPVEAPTLSVPATPPPVLPTTPPQAAAPASEQPAPQAEMQPPPTLPPPAQAPDETVAAPSAAETPPVAEGQKAEKKEEPGFFSRLFGGGKKEPEATEQATAPSPTELPDTEKEEKPSLPIFKELPPIEGPKVVAVAPNEAEVAKEDDDKRIIVKEDGQLTVKHDDNDRFRRRGEDIKVEKGSGGATITTVVRPNGTEVVTVRDAGGDIVQRYRKEKNGQIEILIGERDSVGRPRQHQDQQGPQSGPNGFDFARSLPKLRIPIPRDQYIVGSQGASRSTIEQALIAPPVEAIERPYSLEEIRRSERLRAKLRRIDVDTVNFEFGADTIAEDQVPQLQAIGNALAAIIADDPNEVFLIEGHTDAVGSDLANLALSDRRAESIAVILNYYFNIPPENLVTQGYGEQYLKVLTAGPERQNRRVSVRRITPLLVGQL